MQSMPISGGFNDYRGQKPKVELFRICKLLIIKIIIMASTHHTSVKPLKLGMNPKGQDIYRAASSVIGWIVDVLKVQSCEDILNHGGVVIDLADSLRAIRNCLPWSSIVANEVRHAPSLQVSLSIA